MIDLNNATMKEMVAFYNSHSDKPVKRFSDRTAATRRCAELISELPAELDVFAPEAKAPKKAAKSYEIGGSCPLCGSDSHNITGAGEEGTVAGDTRSYCHDCDREFVNATGREYSPAASNANRSEGIRRSWQDPVIAAKRAQRSAVKVNGELYRSVGQAFRELGLPMNEHIRFRIELKAAGKANAYDRKWEIVPLNHEM